MFLAPQREDQFHINLFFFFFNLSAFKFTLAIGVLIPKPVTGGSFQQTTRFPKFCFCVSVEITIQENSPTEKCECWKTSCTLCVQDRTAWRTGRSEPETWQLSSSVGNRTGNVSHVEYIRAKMAKSALAGVWPWKKETFRSWAPAQLPDTCVSNTTPNLPLDTQGQCSP